jgi:superfamily I DNA and/or RNA helicase
VNAPDGLPPLSLPFVIVDGKLLTFSYSSFVLLLLWFYSLTHPIALHVKHLFTEACQSVEPATLIPVTSTNSCRALVMLGDPCQLPPTVRSGQSTPLSVSLMERLAATLPAPSVSSPVDNTLKDTSYLDTLPVKQAMSLMRSRERGERQQSSYRKRFAGSLLLSIQYRMHPSISAFPSAIFYDGLLATPSVLAGQRSFPRVLKSLMPCGDPNICVRVIDVGGRGNERRGMPSGLSRTVFGSSAPSALEAQTSYWNEPEAQRVVSLIKDVLADADPEVKTIGIVTPYNAQVQLIKGMIASDPDLQKLGQLPATIEVKSVDGYQGRERDLIIFSAVRSNRQGNIGFLHDWRRMNVALTRAKSGLVVICDLKTLSEADKYWDAFGKWAAGVRCVVDDFDSPEDEPSL